MMVRSLQTVNRIYIIGIGYKPIERRTWDIIYKAEVVLASGRLFEVFKAYEEFESVKDKIKVINSVNETIDFMKSKLESGIIVLLASGDPMFFGIGRRAVKEFGKDVVEILPDLSSIQMAFSRIKEPWDDAFLMSLHGGPDPEKRRRLLYEMKDIPLLLKRHNKIAVLTDGENNPAEIAKVILPISSPVTHSGSLRMFVCEKLGYPDEKITEGPPAKIAAMSFLGPNVVIIRNIEPITPYATSSIQQSGVKFGLTEDAFAHSRGLITKDEVRAVAIHKLRLSQQGILWDIGAGSGSVSIEAANLCPELKVIAIEKDEEQLRRIKDNALKFDIGNVETVKGEAPDSLVNLPAPDRVFIGGSGGRIEEILAFITKLPVRIIVANAATLETLNKTIKCLRKSDFTVDVSQVAVSRLKAIGDGSCFAALNPVFVIKGER